jgi:perosamine synthetase
LAVDLDPLKKICKDNNLFLVEDTAEAIGLNYKDTLCGSHGIVSTFSFYPNKHITTGEGGMVITNEPEIYNKLLKLRNLCFDNKKRFFHNEIGWNLRMTNLQAAMGIGQLESLKENVIRKRQIGQRYHKNLSDLKNFNLPLKSLSYSENIYWVFGLVMKNNIEKAEIIINHLKKKNIGSRPFFYPLHKQPVLSKFEINKNLNEANEFLNANYISEYGFYIPSGLGLLNEEIDYVSEVILEIDNLY